MKAIKKIFDVLSGLVYLCILLFLLIAAPLVLGYHPVVVLSGSMEPTYRVGSVIYYKEAPFEQISVGDPITFHGMDSDVLVTHRVVEKLEISREFGTEGDANGSRDPGNVLYENVVGKATKFCIPYAGYFVNYGKQPAAVVAMAAILLLSMLADHLWKEEEKEQKQVEQRK
ncbi:MAG: signal peptidase I [Clostridium sp.]|nr:signal peptidase I [Clostridium sp.]